MNLEANKDVEISSKSLVEMAKSMLQGNSLPYKYWAEAVHRAVYLLNMSPTREVK
jgi:hypothetical protein